jgi:hypothetical protein
MAMTAFRIDVLFVMADASDGFMQLQSVKLYLSINQPPSFRLLGDTFQAGTLP